MYRKVEMELVCYVDKLSYNTIVLTGVSFKENISKLFKSLKECLQQEKFEDYKKIKADLYKEIYRFALRVEEYEKQLQSILKYLKEKKSNTK